MRRRKKLWIVCAALAVVVVLCCFALFYRPAPYRFLRGAEYHGINIHSADWTFYSPKNVLYHDESERTYRIVEVWGRVVEQAELELTPERGWKRESDRSRAMFTKGDESVYIEMDPQGKVSEPDIVWVSIVRPATLLDRAHDWLQNR